MIDSPPLAQQQCYGSIFLAVINLRAVTWFQVLAPVVGSCWLEHAQNMSILNDLWLLFTFASTLRRDMIFIYQILFFQIFAINGRNVTYVPEIKDLRCFPLSEYCNSIKCLIFHEWVCLGQGKDLYINTVKPSESYLSFYIFSPKFSAKIDILFIIVSESALLITSWTKIKPSLLC